MLQSNRLLKQSLQELLVLLREHQAELYLLKFKGSTGQLGTTHKIRVVRRDIARLQTIINQKLQNKEQWPKVIKEKTPKTALKTEIKVESESQNSTNTEVLEQIQAHQQVSSQAETKPQTQESQEVKATKTEEKTEVEGEKQE